jgi:hypothetical protein
VVHIITITIWRGKYNIVRRTLHINNCPKICNNMQFIYICKLLYMFRVVTLPIIRSSYRCIWSIWHHWVRTATCIERVWMEPVLNTVVWAPYDEWSYHSKHAEKFTNVNKLYIVASCWTIIDMYFTMHGPSYRKKNFTLPIFNNGLKRPLIWQCVCNFNCRHFEVLLK